MSSFIRAYLFLGILSFVLLLAGYVLGNRIGLMVAFMCVFYINYYVYFYLDYTLKNQFGCIQMEGRDPWGVLLFLKETCLKLKIPTPKLFTTDFDLPIAFSIGRSKNAANIVISKKMLSILDKEELFSVILHELYHIKKQDILVHKVGLLIINLFSDRGVFNFLSRKYFKQPISSLLFFLIVPKKADYEADKFASSFLGDAEPLASALWKISSYMNTSSNTTISKASHIFIANPLTLSNEDIYSKKPIVARRIKKLLGRYPI